MRFLPPPAEPNHPGRLLRWHHNPLARSAHVTLSGLMKAAASSVLLSHEQIRNRVAELGREISRDYMGRTLTVIGILKGSFIFVADLIRQIDPAIPVEVDFISASSYGNSTSSSGE